MEGFHTSASTTSSAHRAGAADLCNAGFELLAPRMRQPLLPGVLSVDGTPWVAYAKGEALNEEVSRPADLVRARVVLA